MWWTKTLRWPPTVLAVLAASSCIALTCAILFIPRDEMLLLRTSAALHFPLAMGLLFAGVACLVAGAVHAVVPSSGARAYLQGSAEVAALLGALTASGCTLYFRYVWGFGSWWYDEHVMFFASAAVLYGVVALLARRGHSRYSAVLGAVGAPFPFLVRAMIPSACTLFASRTPTPASVYVTLKVGLIAGVLLAGLAIVLRSELAQSTAALRARQPT